MPVSSVTEQNISTLYNLYYNFVGFSLATFCLHTSLEINLTSFVRVIDDVQIPDFLYGPYCLFHQIIKWGIHLRKICI